MSTITPPAPYPPATRVRPLRQTGPRPRPQAGWLRLGVLAPAALACLGCGGGDQDAIMRAARARAAANKLNKANEERVEKQLAERKKAGGEPADQPTADAAAAGKSVPATATKRRTRPGPSNADPPPGDAGDEIVNNPVDEATEKLAEIAEALVACRDSSSKGRYMTAISNQRDASVRLSWRVHLLPYLGYQELYDRFDIEAPWDQEPNKSLLGQMPEVYHTEGLPVGRTRFLAVVGKETIMGVRGFITADQVEDGDGAASTVIVVEGSEASGTPWTKPDDFDYSKPGALRRLGRLRGGFAYAAWADGLVGALDMSKPKRRLIESFRYKDGGPIDRGAVSAPLDAKKMVLRDTTETAPGTLSAGGDAGDVAGTDNADPGAGPIDERFLGFAEPGGLAGKCLLASASARRDGAVVDAWNWLYGAVVAELPGRAWTADMKWTPALRRPTLGLHWAIGATQRGPAARGAPPRGPLAPADQASANRQAFLDAAGPFGESLLLTMEKAATRSMPEVLRLSDEGAPQAPAQRPSPVTQLGLESSVSDLLERADEVGADVLLVLAASPAPNGRSSQFQLTLFDVGKRGLLTRIQEKVDREPAGGRRDGNLQKARWRLNDYIEDHLTPGAWPVRLTPKIAAKRLESLGEARRTGFPPRQLIEMRYYRALELVDDAQLLAATNKLIGGDQGVRLLLGNDTKRRRVVRQWLPNADPAEYVASLERSRRQKDDDD